MARLVIYGTSDIENTLIRVRGKAFQILALEPMISHVMYPDFVNVLYWENLNKLLYLKLCNRNRYKREVVNH